MTNIIKVSAAIFTSVAICLFGGIDNAFTALVCIIVIDYLTGVMSAFYTKTLSSKTGARGIMKKIVILFIISLAHFADMLTGTEIIRSMAIGFYIANEGVSILENAGKMGIKIPQKLKEALSQITNSKL